MREQLSARLHGRGSGDPGPQRAAAIIDKQIRRPSQGMPSKWAKKMAAASPSALGGPVGKLGGGPRVGVASPRRLRARVTGKAGGGGGGAKKVTRAKRVTPPEQLLDPGRRPTRPRRPPTSATTERPLAGARAPAAARPPAARLRRRARPFAGPANRQGYRRDRQFGR